MRWGEKYDGHGSSIKYIDKWAERLEGDEWTKWGDKWDENFNKYDQGVKQGETWWEGKYGERWNHTWEGKVTMDLVGCTSTGKAAVRGEHWNTHVQQDTWYESHATSAIQGIVIGGFMGTLTSMLHRHFQLLRKAALNPQAMASLQTSPCPGSSKLGLRTTAAIIFGRLVLVPPAGLGIVMLADKLGLLPVGDKMFRFVLLLQHMMPTSVLASALANLQGCGREAAAVMFWVHIFAILSMARWIVLYLRILF
ncbi:hypothetical protein IFM89_011876 [Coptis chinensis]|uniref:Uncharacterized protein n=1 Tax=Coptis chinensis TaxID=261450 RepID=A0A835I2K0_9MAGN|nr:hypothetical protein IFM89_011876 [Coptis chinensis]